MRCTSTVLGATGQRQCSKEAVWIARDPKTAEAFARCQEHADRCVRNFGFVLERLPEPQTGEHGLTP